MCRSDPSARLVPLIYFDRTIDEVEIGYVDVPVVPDHDPGGCQADFGDRPLGITDPNPITRVVATGNMAPRRPVLREEQSQGRRQAPTPVIRQMPERQQGSG